MHLIGRVLRALVPLVLALAAPASAQTVVTAETAVWPADPAMRAVVRVADPGAAVPPPAERVTLYLPREVAFEGAALPSCAVATVSASGPAGCSPGSQVGSGRLVSVTGPYPLTLIFDAYVINGAEPGQLVVFVAQVNGQLLVVLDARIGPSDDPAYGSTLTVTVPRELREAVPGVPNAFTELELLLRATVAKPFAAISGCPLGTLPFKALVTFAPGGGPLAATSSAPCAAGPAPAVAPMPQSAASPPDFWPVAAPRFRVEPQRGRGKIRRLRLSGVSTDAQVSISCLQRCGRPGKELMAWRRGGNARLARPLRARARFEVRVGGETLATRFARYEVNRKRTRLRRLATGCLDVAGGARACPRAG